MRASVACLSLLLLVSPLIAGDRPLAELPVRVREGFHIERVYQVSRETEGSWVALAVDPRGRLIASDQTGSLYRINPKGEKPIRAEPIALPIGHAHGLVYAFDSLYAIVAEKVHKGPGLYRLRDTDDDDIFDQVNLLQSFDGTGEHGPHSVVLSPDGQSLFVVAGNKTNVPDAAMENSLVPTHWGEDDLLPRLWGPIGSEVGTPAPGGWIASTDPDGKQWQLHAVGLRYSFDLALNAEGDLFTVDADAEFDLAAPWYQPTRVFHVVAGTDYGWRSGAGKWQPHYADTLPPVVELGSGSPTGITFAKGARFPVRYQNALFVGDWSRGRIVAVHLVPSGSSYRGTVEEIVSGTPLPVTDLLVHPIDGSIYFTIGGREATSGLYRLSWKGNESKQHQSQPPQDQIGDNVTSSRAILRRLSSLYHATDHLQAIRAVWPRLAHSDRTIRHTARTVLEHVPHRLWQERAFAESAPLARMTALLALARSNDSRLIPRVIDSLTNIDFDALAANEQQTLLRCIDIALTRLGPKPLATEVQQQAVNYLEPKFPVEEHALDVQLCRLLIFLDSPRVPKLALQWIDEAVTPGRRMAYAVPLRHQRSGWTNALRTQYFSLLGDAMTWRGGRSLSKYIQLTAADALSQVPVDERERFSALLKQPVSTPATAAKHHPFVREWSLVELTNIGSESLRDADPTAGRKLFAEAQCFACHRFRDEGGAVGPDLTTVVKRLTTRDLLEAIVEPSRVISDQFAATMILTTSGRVLTGRVVNLQRGALLIQTDMLDPANLQRIKTDDIEQMQLARTSMMPKGLLNTLTHDEITST